MTLRSHEWLRGRDELGFQHRGALRMLGNSLRREGHLAAAKEQLTASVALHEELAGPACVALEWPEQVSDGLPGDALTVALGHADETRRTARLTAGGPRAARWLDAVREARS